MDPKCRPTLQFLAQGLYIGATEPGSQPGILPPPRTRAWRRVSALDAACDCARGAERSRRMERSQTLSDASDLRVCHAERVVIRELGPWGIPT